MKGDSQIEALALDRYLPQRRLVGLGPVEFRLHHATVCVIGAGGVASGCLPYLVGAGIKHLIIIDDDHVELQNLHRQTLHIEERVGTNKAESAAQRLKELNGTVRITAVPLRFGPNTSNVLDEYSPIDCLIDTVDNPQTRLFIATETHARRIPLVHAAATAFTITITTLIPSHEDLPCLRCLYRTVPSEQIRSTSLEHGIFGPAAGLAGVLAASEALKLCSLGPQHDALLAGRLLVLNLLNLHVRVLPFPKLPMCPYCGDNAS
ncbi:Molybdopterin biosynthesis MoeB protein [Giardia muris]|uniref:Molybdopterin biosynthesis MoeB protein n=1 Tax=Giardia muris TaxID=5742 RepID=A0A4Z1T4M1_GIAMU|nr:Molybdopterin biosynthesis MoeB protein [Giardia muris]|eukprot:TNJ28017.1 Molybdopterin biosynthesis MoeB protein [Giardia muris]